MRIPRNLSGDDLVRLLTTLGDMVTHQTGSHMHLTTAIDGEHLITIPCHDPLRVGTLAAIVSDVAAHAKLSHDELLARLMSRDS